MEWCLRKSVIEMKKKLFELELPKIYQEGLFEYKPMIDGYPELIDRPKGYSYEKFCKLNKLIQIELLKYNINEARKNMELTAEEIKEAEFLIEEAINEYNEL